MTRRCPHIQDAVDALVAVAMIITGITMFVGYAQPQAILRTIGWWLSMAWAGVLTLASLAALAGVLLRFFKKGFGLELGGWGFMALMVFIYMLANTAQGGSAAGNFALLALSLLLGGKFLRDATAIPIARKRVNDR